MDVAYVSNVVYPFVTGGAEKRIYELGRRLVARGHDVTIYGRHFWDGPRTMDYEGMELRAVADKQSLYVDGRRSIREAVGFATALYKPLSENVDRHDVVVASVFPYFPVMTVAMLLRRRDVPLVTTWHECWREYWWEYLGTLGIGGIATERVVARLPQHPIAVSTLTADRLAEIGPNRQQITVVPNGIDSDTVQNIDPVENPFDAIFVGRLVPAKGLDTLLRALVASDQDCHVGIIGDGPERDRLETLATKLGVDSQVSFLGFIESHERVLAYLRGTDVYVSPSTREGFGLTLVEAMAADCTIVAVDHPRSAAAEVVGDAGFLAGAQIGPLSRALDRALVGERPPTTPTSRAREFDWDRITDQALEAYRAAANTEC